MSDFLTNLVSRSLDPNPAIGPRLVSLYEPLRAADKMMGGVLVDPDHSGQDEAGDSRLSNSQSLQRQAQPGPGTPTATTARLSQRALAHQPDQLLETRRDSHRPEDFFAIESAPDKSWPSESGADQTRELSDSDFSAPQRPGSGPVVPTAMVHSPEKENSARADLAQSPPAKSPHDKSEANPQFEINQDLRVVIESLLDRTIRKPDDATSTSQPPLPATQITASPLSVTEKANQSAPDQVVHSITIQRIVSAGESPEQFVTVEESLADKSVQAEASAEEGRQKTPSRAVRPVTKSIVATNRSTPRFVETEDVSPTTAPVRETASAEEIKPKAPSPAVYPVTIERIVATEESAPRLVATGDVSQTTAPVRETASADGIKPKASSPVVHPVTIEKNVAANESLPRFAVTQEASLTRASVRAPVSAEEITRKASSPAVHPVAIERIVSGGESSQPHLFLAKAPPPVHDVSSARTTVPPQPPAMIVVRPEISQVRPAAETRVDSPSPEPNVQITIGRIEVRAIKAVEVQPKNDRPVQSNFMSLDDYLRQRAQGGKR